MSAKLNAHKLAIVSDEDDGQQNSTGSQIYNHRCLSRASRRRARLIHSLDTSAVAENAGSRPSGELGSADS